MVGRRCSGGKCFRVLAGILGLQLMGLISGPSEWPQLCSLAPLGMIHGVVVPLSRSCVAFLW